MKLHLYNCNDSVNTINKTKTDERIFDITFKDTANISNPIIILKTSELLLYNYAYIPDFNRYYFINSIETTPKNIVRLYLECDVLESFKSEILSSSGVITRNENGNPFYDGGDYISEVKKESNLYYSDVEFEYEENIILTAFKGVE